MKFYTKQHKFYCGIDLMREKSISVSLKDIIRFLRVEKKFLKDEFGVLNSGS